LCYRPTAMDATWPNLTGGAARFAGRLEAWGAARLFGAFKFLPLDSASALGGALARHIGPRFGISKLARRNISRAFPELSETEITCVIASMWHNLGRVAAEYPHLRKIHVFEPGGRVETHGFEQVHRAVAAKRRMIFFSGHIANWEIAALAAVQYGISVAQITRFLQPDDPAAKQTAAIEDLDGRPGTADTAPAELATTGTAPTEPATTDPVIMGTAPTDPNTTDLTTTDLATTELATTDTVGRNTDLMRSFRGIFRGERARSARPTRMMKASDLWRE